MSSNYTLLQDPAATPEFSDEQLIEWLTNALGLHLAAHGLAAHRNRTWQLGHERLLRAATRRAIFDPDRDPDVYQHAVAAVATTRMNEQAFRRLVDKGTRASLEELPPPLRPLFVVADDGDPNETSVFVSRIGPNDKVLMDARIQDGRARFFELGVWSGEANPPRVFAEYHTGDWCEVLALVVATTNWSRIMNGHRPLDGVCGGFPVAVTGVCNPFADQDWLTHGTMLDDPRAKYGDEYDRWLAALSQAFDPLDLADDFYAEEAE